MLRFVSVAATTTVRLSEEERAILDRAAERYGSRSAALRRALRLLDEDLERREAMRDFLRTWEEEVGPIDPAGVERMRQAYGER